MCNELPDDAFVVRILVVIAILPASCAYWSLHNCLTFKLESPGQTYEQSKNST